MLIGLIAFIAGMLAGFISLRALGWLCIVGLILLPCVRVSAACNTVTVHNAGGASASYQFEYFSGGVWHGFLSSSCPAGGDDLEGYTGGCTGCEAGIIITGCNGGAVYDLGVTWSALDCKVVTINGCNTPTNNIPPSTYSASGCITNLSAVITGYYLHTSVPTQPCSGGAFQSDYYSGPLAPNQYYCVCISNSGPFQVTAQQIFYNSDGGTNAINTGPPQWAGTNAGSPPIVGFPGGTPPGNGPGTSPTGPGTGAGSNTNLTGGQFNNGVSNLYNVILQVGNLDAGLLSKIDQDIQAQGTNSQLDYRSYLITLTNQGEGHLTMTKVLTNLAGQEYTQIVQVAALSATNFAWMTNDYAAVTNAWGALTNGGGHLVDTNAMAGGVQASNEFMSASLGNEGTYATAGSNFISGSPSFSILDLPIRTNVNSSGNWHVGFEATNVFQQVAPWIRLITDFIIFTFAVGYVHSRVQEECVRLGWIQGTNYNVANAVSKLGWIGIKGAAKVAGLATLFGSLPPAIGLAVAYFVTRYGGVPVSPLSDSGVAYAGTYSNSILYGYNLLNYFVSFPYAMAVMVYLFFFDMTITGTILFLQRLIKWTPQ